MESRRPRFDQQYGDVDRMRDNRETSENGDVAIIRTKPSTMRFDGNYHFGHDEESSRLAGSVVNGMKRRRRL